MQRQTRSIVALLSSVFVSSAAALALTTVLGKQVYDLTHSDLDLGLLGLAEFGPSAMLVLVTGTLADRFDRRRLAAGALLGEAMVAGGLAWYASTQPTSVIPIFLLVIAFGTARAFATPPARALTADVVPRERLPWLVVRQSAMWQAALIVGPVLGGFLYVVHKSAPFLAAVVLLGSAALAVTTVELAPGAHRGRRARGTGVVEAALERAETLDGVAPSPEPGGVRDAMEGLRFIRRQPILLGAISLDLFAVLFGGAVALLPAIATHRLGVGAVGLGWLRAATGIGAAVVTITLAARPITRRVGHTLLGAVACFGIGTLVLGATTSFVVAFIALAALSGADAVSVFIRATLVPLATPDDKRGRVLAVENVFIGASNEVGAFESGVTGQLLGTAPAVVVGGVATLAVAGLSWFVFPALRSVDRFPGPGAIHPVEAAGS